MCLWSLQLGKSKAAEWECEASFLNGYSPTFFSLQASENDETASYHNAKNGILCLRVDTETCVFTNPQFGLQWVCMRMQNQSLSKSSPLISRLIVNSGDDSIIISCSTRSGYNLNIEGTYPLYPAVFQKAKERFVWKYSKPDCDVCHGLDKVVVYTCSQKLSSTANFTLCKTVAKYGTAV